MKQKTSRLQAIRMLISRFQIGSQEELISKLEEEQHRVTQATLSRDLKELRVVKVPNAQGQYVFRFESALITNNTPKAEVESKTPFVVRNTVEFSGQLAVLKTKPGHAGAIASEIDSQASDVILGTIAGDDTVLLIPREGVARRTIIEALARFIQIDYK